MTSQPFGVDTIPVRVLERVNRLCLDFERSFRAGDVPRLESYLERVSNDCYRAALYYLIELERDLLCERGIEPSLQQYQERFPDQRQVVELAWGESPHFEVVLEVIIGPHRGRCFTFQRHDNFIVGRADCAHFRLPHKDPYFSRVHFLVEVNPPQCRLVDLRSLNGTKVNGGKVAWADLQDDDLIQAGDTVMRVSIRQPECVPPLATDTPQECTPQAAREWKRSPAASSGAQVRHVPPAIPGYELLAPLGRGGMGVVHRAKRIADGTEVAIKIIKSTCIPSDREVQRFLREAQILCALQHPNIVRFHQFGRSNDQFYIVMDLVAGGNAMQLVEQHGPLGIGRAVRIVCQALDALQYAHAQGYVHRDVKPSNLLVSGHEPAEVCRLADFGLARVYCATRMSGLTLMGDLGGTLPFMAPEQITNFREAKPAVDQYGAAATLYYLCTGQSVLADDTSHDVGQITMRILLAEPVPIERRRADIPPALGRLIHTALAKKPEDRLANVAALRAALAAYEHG